MKKNNSLFTFHKQFTLFVVFAFILQFGFAPAFRTMAKEVSGGSFLIFKKGLDVLVNGKPGENGMKLNSGDSIETRPGTEVEIKSVGKSTIKVFQNARLVYNFSDERVDVTVNKGCTTIFLDPTLKGSLTLPKGAVQEYQSGETSFLTSCGSAGNKTLQDDDDCDDDGIKNDQDDDDGCNGGAFWRKKGIFILVGIGIGIGLLIYFATKEDDDDVISPSTP
jgi:hypothetical protein